MTDDGRNFDDLVERLGQRVHGSFKGKLRLRASLRQMQKSVPELSQRPLRVLDVGAGLGQVALTLASQGHTVFALDISERMIEHVLERAKSEGLNVQGLRGSIQAVAPELLARGESFDLICCHAALEWMNQPESAVSLFKRLLKPGAAISLLCYNNAALVHRNLLRGNFRRAQQTKMPGTSGGLTPTHMFDLQDLESWLSDQSLGVIERYGVRSILDYLPPTLVEERGLDSLDAVEQWLEQREPHWRLARYLHLIARNQSVSGT